jgi:hypothetical protein
MSDESDAPKGGDITTPVTQPVEGPINVRQATDALKQGRDASEAGRVLAGARKEKWTDIKEAPVQAVEHQESAVEADAAPLETEAPGETQEVDPAEVPPIEPPRSWTKEAKDRWQSLPRETQEYLATREQERDREIRRSQNEAAEKLKGASAKEQQLEQARQQYEAALPALLQTLHQAQAGEFADVKTHADLERLAAEDPIRYLKWDAHQKKVAQVSQELRAAQERQAQEQHGKFAEFAKREDDAFLEKAPEFADKDKAAKLQGAAIETLRDLGFSEDELGRLWNGQDRLSLRDHRLQLLIRDGVKYREGQEAAKKIVAKPLPPVQRPGAAQPKGAHLQSQHAALTAKLPKAKGLDGVRIASEIRRLERQMGR